MAVTSMGRKRGIDPAASVEKVMDAAEELILAGGFAPATVADLADKAGVSRATVFSRFGSKLGVLEALCVRCAGGPEMRAIRAAVALPDPVESARAIVDASCDQWEQQGHLLLTLKAVVELEPGAVTLIDEQRNDQRTALEHVVKGLEADGRLRGLPRAQAVAAFHLVTSVESFMELRRNAGLSLAATKKVLTGLAEGLFDLEV